VGSARPVIEQKSELVIVYPLVMPQKRTFVPFWRKMRVVVALGRLAGVMGRAPLFGLRALD
jgi:hypothetical protein